MIKLLSNDWSPHPTRFGFSLY